MELQYGQGYGIRPGRTLLQANAVAAASKELASRDQFTVLGSLIFEPRRVPDKSHQLAANERSDLLKNKSRNRARNMLVQRIRE